MQRARLWTLLMLCVPIIGCGSSGGNEGHNPPPADIVPLSYEDMFSSADAASAVSDTLFALPADAIAPSESFEGKLDLLETAGHGGFTELRDDWGNVGAADSPMKHLPEISVEFVQDGAELIPVKEGIVFSGHQVWNYIVGPGKVWQLGSDSGYMRASFPLTLVERANGFQDCLHNGTVTFLFSNSHSPHVSNVRYQVTQETCMTLKFDMWGKLPARYSAYSMPDGNRLKQEHALEVARRLPTKPFSALAVDFPAAGVDLASFLKDFHAPEHITTYGLVVNGINYASGCPTRYGTYPFCDDMRLPSYSTAKSSYAGVALMRLGQLYGSDAYRQLIRNFVPEYAMGGDWTAVTFDHAADMTTGNFLSTVEFSDNGSPEELAFFTAEPYMDKIADSFRPFPHRAQPGTTFVYQTHATFILAQAMSAYSQQQGGNPDSFNLVRDEVYGPLGISKGGLTTLRSDNRETGHPFAGYGLFHSRDDIAKIGKLLAIDDGVIDGKQVLDPARLRDSLFRGTDLGLPARDINHPPAGGDTLWYNNGFWGKKMTRAEFPQYSCDFWVSYMSGTGGINIVLMPNKTVFYVFSDNGEYGWSSAANESNKIASFCAP